MADQEARPESEHEEEEEVSEVEAEEEEKEMDIHTAISGVLKQSSFVNGLCRGLNESAKAIDQGKAKITFLAKDCDEANYKKLINGLCREKNIPIIEVDSRVDLGQWAGLCKYDVDGNARGACKCSCVVVTKIDEAWESYRHLSNHVAAQKK
jgi:small subunit ribosomal protein S12e